MKLRLDEYYYIINEDWGDIENYMPEDMAEEFEKFRESHTQDEISFIDGHKDTITVWTDPEYGDYIKMYDNGGVFTKGNIVLRYIPYKKYTRSDFPTKINLYNVLYYNKLKMQRY